MGFWGPSKEEKARQEELRRGVDLVYSASVPFDYKIIHPGIWTCCRNDDLSEAIKTCENSLRDQAINYDCHIVLDVKIVSLGSFQYYHHGDQISREIIMTGVLIRRLN